MKSSFLAAVAVAVLSAPAVAQVPGYQDPAQPDCPSGVCPRVQAAVQTVRHAGAVLYAGLGAGRAATAPSPAAGVSVLQQHNDQHGQYLQSHGSSGRSRQGTIRVRQAVTFTPGQPIRNFGRAVLTFFQ